MKPRVSVIIPTYNAEAYIGRALASACTQTSRDIEVIVVDDASSDGTLGIVSQVANTDSRVQLVARQHNGGPSAARNDGIRTARGEWIAVLDADDEMAANRLERLLEISCTTAADIVADNIIIASTSNARKSRPALPDGAIPYFLSVDAPEYVRRNMMLTPGFKLGYLKPMFRREMLQTNDLSYNENVRIGEDYLLCLEALLAGARFVITSDAFYKYWVNSGSLSSKLTRKDILALKAAQQSIAAKSTWQELRIELTRYDEHLQILLGYTDFIETAKQRRLAEAAKLAIAAPRMWLHICRGGSQAIAKRLRLKWAQGS